MNLNSYRGARIAAALSLLLFVAACSSGPRIVTNSAPGFSLAGYQTFSFLQPLSTDNGNVRSLLSGTRWMQRKRALTSFMTSCGGGSEVGPDVDRRARAGSQLDWHL